MAKPKIDWALLDRYFKDEVTLRERQVVEQWLHEAGSEDIRAFFTDLRDDPEIRQLQAEVWTRLQRGDVPTLGAGPRAVRRETGAAVRPAPKRARGALKAAAVVTLLLGGGPGRMAMDSDCTCASH